MTNACQGWLAGNRHCDCGDSLEKAAMRVLTLRDRFMTYRVGAYIFSFCAQEGAVGCNTRA